MARELGAYRSKRDFGATPEPSGSPAETAPEQARFVVQEHHARRLHWDLRLEHDGALASWAIPNGIPPEPKQNRKAVRTEDHPLEYLSFHGEIPRGQYGAGTMTIWDSGSYECHKWEPRKVIVSFHGERLEGRYALFATGPERDGEPPKDWMIHRMDPPADAAREPMPERVVPMLAKLAEPPRGDGRWGYELKWDGIRAIAYLAAGRLRLESRNGNDVTAQYLELRGLTRALGSHEAVLDGEIVAFDEAGRPSFERLQQRMHQGSEATVRRRMKTHPVTYVAFDLIYLDGRSLLERPYAERREALAALALDGPHWRTPSHSTGDGRALLEATRGQGLEGLVAKRLDSRYEPGVRSGAWLKLKNAARQELVIGGWVPGEGRRRNRIGALLLGFHEGDRLRFAGKVGTGFSEAELDRLAGRLAPLRRETTPFEGRQPQRGAVFCEPRLVAEVEFSEWTRDGLLRHPSYKGLRDDKDPREVTLERADARAGDVDAPLAGLAAARESGRARVELEVEGRTLRLSNLDKVLYPRTGFTKGDLIEFYMRVAPVLLPHLKGRPLTLKRYPNGVEGGHFYEKRCPSHRPDWVRTAPVWSGRARGPIEFCLVEDLPTLVWLANLADLELHTSLSLAEAIERPTAMVFDLDPGEPAGIVDCCRVGVLIRGMLTELGLASFAKTSGSKGLQLYVPLNTEVSYETTKPFARAVAETLGKGFPELVVSRMAKSLRPGKVLVDWSQNDDKKTTVNVYSLRARPTPTVSTPVGWDEVERALEAGDPAALSFEHDELLARVAERGDPFAPVLSERQELPPLGAG